MFFVGLNKFIQDQFNFACFYWSQYMIKCRRYTWNTRIIFITCHHLNKTKNISKYKLCSLGLIKSRILQLVSWISPIWLILVLKILWASKIFQYLHKIHYNKSSYKICSICLILISKIIWALWDSKLFKYVYRIYLNTNGLIL